MVLIIGLAVVVYAAAGAQITVERPVLRGFNFQGGLTLIPEFVALTWALAFYTSGFIANLGSLKMKAGYHHLYEWGTCPLFLMLGKVEDRAMVEDGEVVARKVLHIRFSFDERVDDGLNAGKGINALRRILEDPYRYFGDPKSDDFGSAEMTWAADDSRLPPGGTIELSA